MSSSRKPRSSKIGLRARMQKLRFGGAFLLGFDLHFVSTPARIYLPRLAYPASSRKVIPVPPRRAYSHSQFHRVDGVDANDAVEPAGGGGSRLSWAVRWSAGQPPARARTRTRKPAPRGACVSIPKTSRRTRLGAPTTSLSGFFSALVRPADASARPGFRSRRKEWPVRSGCRRGLTAAPDQPPYGLQELRRT